MTVKSRAELKGENSTDFPDNVQRLISPADLRGQMDDIADSAILREDLTALGLYPMSDAGYDAVAWDGVTEIAPSKNAVRDKIVAMDAATDMINGTGAYFLQEPGTTPPAYVRSLNDRMKDTIHLFDFIPPAQHAAIMAGTSTYDAAQNLRDAIDQFSWNAVGTAVAGPTILLPPGLLLINSTIQLKKTVRISGAGGAMYGNRGERTVLRWPIGTDGFVLHHFDTKNHPPEVESPSTTEAGGTIFENFALETLVVGDTSTPPAVVNHAITCHCKFDFRDLRIRNWGGDGIHVDASNGVAFAVSRGNANGWRMSGGRITGCRSGLWIDGADANAGMALKVDCSTNREWGFYDASTLGNAYFACHTNVNARTARRWYDGKGYICGNLALGLVNPPSEDDPDTWGYYGDYPGGASTFHPLWTAGDVTLSEGGGYNCHGTLWSCYCESGDLNRIPSAGGSVFSGISPSKVIGDIDGTLLYSAANFTTTRRLRFEKNDAHGDGMEQTFFGLPSSHNQLGYFQHDVYQPSAVNTDINLAEGAITVGGTGNIFYQTLTNTRQQFGRSAPVAGAIYIGKLFLGTNIILNPTATEAWTPDTAYLVDAVVLNDGGTTYVCTVAGTSAASGGPTGSASSGINDGTAEWGAAGATTARQITFRSAIPTADNWAVGDFIINNAPAAGEPWAWRCTVGGTPGTWQSMRDFSSQQTITSGAAIVLTPGTSPFHTLYATATASDRTATLSKTGALQGLSYKITRTAGGAGNLNVLNGSAGPLLKALVTNTWGEFAYDGTDYYVAAYGTL